VTRVLTGVLILFCALACPQTALAQDAEALKARHAALATQLTTNHFKRPLYLQSTETPGDLQGHVYARLDQPFAVAGPALRVMGHWCDILILHQNVKSCRPSASAAGNTLRLHIGRKGDQPLADAYPFEFLYTVVAVGSEYLQAALNAEEGPLDTTRYRIVLEVVALDAKRSFMHLSYAYSYGPAARMAMRGYLRTIGRRKVGFSIEGKLSNGEPVYIGGTRGVVERNTMRYYLAIEAYLAALSVPAGEQLQKRLGEWYAGIERYPVQLHELDRDE
jgi:hypothetical protein